MLYNFFCSFNILFSFSITFLKPWYVTSLIIKECNNLNNVNEADLLNIAKSIVPEMCGKHKGEAGKIGVIGGSTEYTGAPFFAAITALKVGADLVYVITSENAAPVIKTYSPDLIVLPQPTAFDLREILARLHVVIIGPGLGRNPDSLKLVYDVIEMCKDLKKPLVIDADGLYAIYKNVSVLIDYPGPGAVLTPNHIEAQRLKVAISSQNKTWYKFWGDNVSILEKGAKDQFHTAVPNLNWTLSEGGSCRRAGGQGDILAGALGAFLNWGLKTNICECNQTIQISQSVAAFAAAKFTRTCNALAFQKHGRSMLASDMLQVIHSSFESLFSF